MANDLPSNAFDDMPKQSPVFPPMFVANINSCITKENVDIQSPWPRSIVEYNSDSNNRPQESKPVCSGNLTFGPIPVTDPADTSATDSITENSHSTSCSCGCQGN